jgi:hypothetical protein
MTSYELLKNICQVHATNYGVTIYIDNTHEELWSGRGYTGITAGVFCPPVSAGEEERIIIYPQGLDRAIDLLCQERSDFDPTNFEHLTKVVTRIIRHECRHLLQWRWMESTYGKTGGLYIWCQIQRHSKYVADPLEWDANRYAKGKEDPLDDVMRDVIKGLARLDWKQRE